MLLSTTTNRHGADLACGGERLHAESRGPAALPASTGVRVDRLERLLSECTAVPREEREIVVRRFREGADIGYSGLVGGRVTPNNRSATMRVDGVTAAVDREVRSGATRGPFAVPPYSDLVVNALSARDKPNGDVRLILDLSQPVGSAVNEGIDPEQFRVVYTSIDEAIRLIHRVGGTEAQIFKADIKNAFKLIPVRPDQWRLLGFRWLGAYYFQVCLPFGCRSSPRLFNDFADCLEKLFQAGSDDVFIRHYLDDFYGISPAHSKEADRTYGRIKTICRDVGVPLAEEKCVPPTTRVELLGVVLGTGSMTVALPERKLSDLREILGSLAGRRKCTQRELLSIVGKLVHASKCVPPGRAFTRRLLDAAYSVTGLQRRIRINAAVRADIRWWDTFLPLWNGSFPMVTPPSDESAGIVLHTDSSRWGMGACDGRDWWTMEWPSHIQQDAAPSMTWLELIPVMVACLIWGEGWGGQRVRVYTDNMGVVGVWGRGWSGNQRIMELVRQLLFWTAHKQFILDILHVDTKQNGAADSLSRNDMTRFRQLRPHAARQSARLPGSLTSYLADPIGGSHLLTGFRL